MKLNTNQRASLFWCVCIPLRMYLTTLGDSMWLRVSAALIGTRWLTGMQVGDEGMFGGYAWWADERPLHGALWLAYATTGKSEWLKADVAFGIGNWMHEHLKVNWHVDFIKNIY